MTVSRVILLGVLSKSHKAVEAEEYPETVQMGVVVSDHADCDGTGDVGWMIVDERRRRRGDIERRNNVEVSARLGFRDTGFGGVGDVVERVGEARFVEFDTGAGRPVRQQRDRYPSPDVAYQADGVIVDDGAHRDELARRGERADQITDRGGELVVIKFPTHEFAAKRTAERRPEERPFGETVSFLDATLLYPVVVADDPVEVEDHRVH